MGFFFTVENGAGSGSLWAANMAFTNAAHVRDTKELTTDIAPSSWDELARSGLGQMTRQNILESAGVFAKAIVIDRMV